MDSSAKDVFIVEGGHKIPLHFGNVREEWLALRRTVGVADRTARGKIIVSGSDRVRFLQGLVTNDVAALSPGQGCHAALLDQRGHTLADMWIHHRGETFMLETEPGLQQKLLAMLERQVVGEEVQLCDSTLAEAVLGIQGPAARNLAATLFRKVPVDLPPTHSVDGRFMDTPVHLVARDYTGLPGYDLWVAVDFALTLWEALLVRGRRHGVCPVGALALEARRIEAGIPRYGVDIDDSVLPQEAGLDDTLQFDKACYPGQQAIAKMRREGEPRRRLVRLIATCSPAPATGTPVFDGAQQAGKITSSVRPVGHEVVFALGHLSGSQHAHGKIVKIGAPDGPKAMVTGYAGAAPAGQSIPPTPATD